MLSGNPQIFGINTYEQSSTPLHQLGTKGITADGRIFRYTQAAGTGIATGKLCVAPRITTNHEDIAFATAGVVGDKSISITLGATAVTANEYDEGYVVIVDDTGEGHTHEIVRHGVSASGSEAITIDLKTPLVAATTTSTTVTLVRNNHRDVIIAVGGTQTDIPVGVTPIAVTADYYFWAQTGGWASLLSSGTNTCTAGEPATIGEATDGSVSGRDSVAEPLVGIAGTTVNATSGEHNAYFLMMDN